MSGSSSVALIDWKPYTGASAVLLGAILLVIGAAIVFWGTRKATPSKVRRAGKGLEVFVVALWIVSILLVRPMFQAVALKTGQSALGTGPVLPITLTCALVSFLAVAYLTRGRGLRASLGSGFAAAVAGPMVFELPFVLIIAPEVTTPVPHPLLLFSTFLVVILTTLALPTFSSRFSITKYSLFLLGAMFLAFGLWALATGYAPPADATSFSLNAISKVLGFAAVVACFAGAGSNKATT